MKMAKRIEAFKWVFELKKWCFFHTKKINRTTVSNGLICEQLKQFKTWKTRQYALDLSAVLVFWRFYWGCVSEHEWSKALGPLSKMDPFSGKISNKIIQTSFTTQCQKNLDMNHMLHKSNAQTGQLCTETESSINSLHINASDASRLENGSL